MRRMLTVLAAVMTAAVVQMIVPSSALAESASPGGGTVAVSSQDASAGTVTLTFGGERSDSVLYIARDDADKGATPSAWVDVKPLACVKATDTSYVCTVPVEMRRKGGVVRFFLVQPDESVPYLAFVDYIRPTTTSSEYNYNTGIVPKQTTGITLDFQVTGDSADEISVFGVWTKCGMMLQRQRSFHYVPGINSDYLCAADLGHKLAKMGSNRHQLVFDRGTFLDGEVLSVTKSTSATDYYNGGYDNPMADGLNTIRLFQLIENKATYSASGLHNNEPAVRIYGFDVRENGNPVASLRPCVSKAGVPCFWDSIRKTLIGPSKKDAATADNCYAWGALIGDMIDGETSASDALEIGMEFGWRKITVSAVSGSTELTLTFAGSGVKHLYVAHDMKDRGTDPAAWADVEAVADIPADATSFVYAIPEKWQGVDHVLRFFLASPGGMSAYDDLELYQWVYHGEYKGFIDTGIVPDRTTKLSLDLRFNKDFADTSGEHGIVGIWPYLGTFSQRGSMFVNLPGIDTTITDYLKALESGTDSAWGEKRQMMRIGCDEFSYDGVQRALFNSNNAPYTGTFTNERIPQTTRTLPLFKMINEDGSDLKNNCENTWLYGCDIVTNGNVLAARLIPAKRGWMVGLYDEVCDRFLRPTYTEPFSTHYSAIPFSVGGGTRGPTLTMARRESSVLFRQVRTVTAATIDRATGSVTLTFGGVPLNGTIFALRNRDGDRGDDPADWAEVLPIGAVSAQETEKTLVGVLPRKWMRQGGAIRFVVAQMPAYETRLEWAGNSEEGGSWPQHILTGYHPTENCEITIKARHKVQDYTPFGVYDDNYQLLYAFPHSANFFAGFFGDQPTVTGPSGEVLDFVQKYKGKTIDETPPYELRISKDGLWFPDLNTKAYDAFTPTSKYQLNADGSSLYDLCLFGCKSSTRCKYGTPIRLYSATAKEGGETVFDLVPVVKDGVVCFYDKTHGNFLTNSGSGAFVAGPDIGYQLDEAVVCGDLSDPVVLPPFGLFIVVK